MKGKTACFSNPKEDFKCLFKGGRKAKCHSTPGQIQQKARTPDQRAQGVDCQRRKLVWTERYYNNSMLRFSIY